MLCVSIWKERPLTILTHTDKHYCCQVVPRFLRSFIIYILDFIYKFGIFELNYILNFINTICESKIFWISIQIISVIYSLLISVDLFELKWFFTKAKWIKILIHLKLTLWLKLIERLISLIYIFGYFWNFWSLFKWKS